MDDLSVFCCRNSACADAGRRGAGNLTVTDRCGKDRQFRMLRCRTCAARFSERKGTPMFNVRLPEARLLSVLEHLADGCGIRQTERLVKVSQGTVMRYARRAGQHAKAAHDELVALSPPHPRGPDG